MRVLGVNAGFHDPAAALVVDGEIVAALGVLREAVRATGDGGFVTVPVVWDALAKRRRAGEDWTAEHADLAASVQRRLEEVLLELVGWLYVLFVHRVNTSLNTAGRPIVDDPRDVLELFGSTAVDLLVLGPFLVRRPLSGAGG